VASHGSEHRFIYHQTPSEFERDVASSIDVLQTITGKSVIGYRAPYFSITKKSVWALEILKRLGIAYDSSIFPARNHRYGMPDAPRQPHMTGAGVFEIPLTTYPISSFNLPCAGGIYFRAFPYALSRACFRRLNRRGESIAFYLHPWECDPGHPVLPVARTLRVRHYWRLDRTADRLAQLLRDFRFVPFRELM
jgi:polysaccharide deacetylase family protein (PEP-CTERM system associated)